MYYGLYNRLRVHVGASPKHVLRALYRKLKPSAKKRANRDARHAIARAILREHCDAREIFIHYRF